MKKLRQFPINCRTTEGATRSKHHLAQRYISLLKRSLVGELYIENEYRIIAAIATLLNNRPLAPGAFFGVDRNSTFFQAVQKSKLTGDALILHRRKADGSTEEAPDARNVTELSHTMIGIKRLNNIQYCIETVLNEKVQGDLIETGVWRGGATIFMRGVLAAYDVSDRSVWVADSFQGVPPPSYPQDAGFDISARVLPVLAVSQQAVAELFERYGLLDDQVKFLSGWFKDTLPAAPIDSIALLRLDGDLYESTMDALKPLYDKVEKGGFIIVDDYESCPPCKQATHDFRNAESIVDEMISIDNQGVFWRKS